jgi:hypothetical protein
VQLQLVPRIGKLFRKSMYLFKKNIKRNLETENLLPCSQLPDTEPYHEPADSNPPLTPISLRYFSIIVISILMTFFLRYPGQNVCTATSS